MNNKSELVQVAFREGYGNEALKGAERYLATLGKVDVKGVRVVKRPNLYVFNLQIEFEVK